MLLLATACTALACPRRAEVSLEPKKDRVHEETSGDPAPVTKHCEPLRDGVLVTEHWSDPPSDLVLVGTVIGEVESDLVLDVYSVYLLFVSAGDRCITGRAAVGELTVPRDGMPLPGPDAPARIEKLRLGDRDVALIWLVRDVKWGLTEEYMVPVSVTPVSLIAGDRVLARRDSFGGTAFYSEVRVGDVDGDGAPEIVLERDGMGTFPPRVVGRRGDDGRFSWEEVGAEEKPPGGVRPEWLSCASDDECGLVAGDCCGCGAGGTARAMGKKHSADYVKMHRRECGKVRCPAVMSSHRSCRMRPACVGGVCKLVPRASR